jgi:hypothetical protein
LFVNENRNYWAPSPKESIQKVLRETGENIMQVARLLPLNLNRWGSVIDTLTSVFDDIKQEKVEDFGITFLDTNFKPSPYMQVALNLNGDLLVELVSNEYLVTKLTKWQESQVRLLGFKMPDENNPNYHRATKANEQPVYTARQLLDAARTVFEVRDDCWFTFGQSDYEKALAGSSAFWHNSLNESQLCLPGMNANSTREGLLASRA